ncbi:carbamoyltransferase family protein [Nocardiopsis ansamitocini]|uniref:Nodulation protein NolNO n=1 Tax=Nocardiopsis ansamitocini TaxID=1670832 RepID=A0A9W6ULR7_9ACTN|nr:carbamoyltransferase C-terminal domain-containing protein [Nocardiopsis ansamitocini]GLU50345.1 nodulation protein NolNO [Nocardiopsis ansamitocini]
MLVLGLNGNFSAEDTDLVPDMLEFFFHDASASLIRDGVLIAAVEEERLNRIKKTTKFPANAIRACLATAGVTPDDIDAVGYYFREDHMDAVLNQLYTDDPRVPVRHSRRLIKDRLKAEFGWELPDDRLVYIPHHVAHATSALVRSGMDEALVVIMDGRGEEESGTVFRSAGGHLESLATYPAGKSLGSVYLSATQFLGYKFGDEYKVMGLAPYGDPARYRDVFQELYTLEEKGEYTVHHSTAVPNLIGPPFAAVGLLPRRKGEPFAQEHKDFAAGLQEAVEKIALHVLRYWAETTGLTRLAFGGGVAHNCSLNGAILRSGLFDEVFVHPASHDSGAGEGAALAAGRLLGASPRPLPRLRSASVGPDLGSLQEIAAALAGWAPMVEVEQPHDIVGTTARLLAQGAVIGWAHGGSEFGPRALGNRSIIADARPAQNQTRINAMVKKRESFRPFAPVVTVEAAHDYFELPATAANYDFMSFVVRVREEHRRLLGAVTHVDGTARVQVVDARANERFHRLVDEFGRLTGTPVLLNTSFNNNAEPIVQSVHDVITGFLTTGLDALVIEDFLVRRGPGGPLGFDNLALRFRPVTRLATRVRPLPAGQRVTTHEIFLDYSTGPRAEVSAALFSLLTEVDDTRSLAAQSVALTDGLKSELFDLWQQRFFELRPL